MHGGVDGLLGAGGRRWIVQVLGEILWEQRARGGCARGGRLGRRYLGGVGGILPGGVCGGGRVGELAPVEEVGGDVRGWLELLVHVLGEAWRGCPRVCGVLRVRGGGGRGGAVQRLVLERIVLVLVGEMGRGVREHGARGRDTTDNFSPADITPLTPPRRRLPLVAPPANYHYLTA